MVDCPKSYLPKEFAVDFDRTKAINGPFGTGKSDNVCIHSGKCSSDSLFFNDDQVRQIAKCALNSYDKHI